MDDILCEWPFPQCGEPATGLMAHGTGRATLGTKALCGSHFRQVEAILWARGLTWTAEPMGLARKALALRRRAASERLSGRVLAT